MIGKYIKIQGGLGNQLFQYAYGRSLELQGKKILFDTSFFHGNKPGIDTSRDFKLDKFQIGTVSRFENFSLKKKTLIDKILGLLGFLKNEYYQNEKYFSHSSFFIRNEFRLKVPPSKNYNVFAKKITSVQCAVSLHIRRGDYINDQKTNVFHGACSPDYYTSAQRLILENINDREVTFFIFSDEIAWVKNHMKFESSVSFVSSPELHDYEELILMSKCKHNIIANSTFSWWGAWLNENPNKIVVAPKKWFANSKKNICPKEWIRI